MQYVVGWDGGGTKTKMSVLDLQGNLLWSDTAGSLNFNSCPREEVIQTIDTLVGSLTKFTDNLAHCQGICICAAGISNKAGTEFLLEQLTKRGITGEITLVGDHEAAFMGAIGKPEGMILVSGTGSICYGKNRGISHRTGGYGHLIDDEGSGYAIGRDLLATGVQLYDKRMSNSIVLELLYEELKVESVEELIRFTYQENWKKSKIASLAPLLLKALKEEDWCAEQICEKASRELVKLVLPVANLLSLENGELAFLGGILEHYEPITHRVTALLTKEFPELHIVKPKGDSAIGAALLAKEKVEMRRI